MLRINRSEIDSGYVLYGNPESDIYAIYIDDCGENKWVAAEPKYAIEYAINFGGDAVAEIAEGVAQYEVAYADGGSVGEHIKHNVMPTVDVRIDCESLRIDDVVYLCHRCQSVLILGY